MRKFSWVLKLGFSALLIAVLIRRYPISLTQIGETFRGIYIPWLLIALVLLFNQYVLSSIKWLLILRSHGIRVPLRQLIRSYMISHFFATFLPSSYMGDIVRVTDVGRMTGRAFESAAAVVLERLSGLVALTTTGYLASIVVAKSFGDPDFMSLAWLFFALFLILVSIFVPGALKVFRAVIRLVPLKFAHRAFEKVASVVMHYRRRPRLLAQIMLLSFAFHIETYTIIYLYAHALGLDVPYIYCLAFLPVVYLLEALPISIGGFGPREGGLIFFLGNLGIGASGAISLSIVMVSGRYLMNLTGGVLFALRRRLERLPETADAGEQGGDSNRGERER